jgi:peptide/nickel transport system ATP-binding protein
VRGISFTIEKGETLGIVGESGCGKTTVGLCLLRMLPRNGRIREGNIMLNGTDLMKLSDEEIRRVRWHKISMIFQGAMNALNPVTRVGDLLTEVLQNHETVSKKEAEARIRELFETVRLPIDRITAYPHELSGGMRQRVVIALSLLCRPQLVIADEPTTAFDVVVQDQVLGTIENVQKQLGLGMILITHDIAVVAETCHRMAVMYAGEIVEEGKVEDVFYDPRHPYTRALLGAVPSLTGPRRQLQSLTGHPPNLINVPTACAFAPRCPFAEEICTREPPSLIPINTKHYAKCFFAKDLDSQTEKKSIDNELQPAILRNSRLESMKQHILKIEAATKIYRPRMGVTSSLLGRKENIVRAVDSVDLNLSKGDVLALVGESGSGKSTLARLICALEPLSGGRIQFMNDDLSNMRGSSLKELRRQIQMVFQDPYDSLDPRCTVYETISEPLIIQGIPSKECMEQVGRTLEEVELRPYNRFINRYPHELSGGERQRVALARAIVFRPSLIVADEPVSMVDASMKAGIINLMLHLHQSLSTTYLFVTHDLSIARHIADRIAIMYLGKIVEIGPPDQVIKAPRHPYTNMLVSAVPIPNPNERKQRVQAIGEPPSATDIPSGCRFHPRCIHAKDKCRSEEPIIRKIAPNHSTACFYPLE